MYKILSIYFILLVLNSSAESNSSTDEGLVTAPRMSVKAANQLGINNKGCGPISLLNSYRFGSEKWQQALTKLRGDSDEEKFNDLVRFGRKFSRHTGMLRWDNQGIKFKDLTDLANDFHKKRKTGLPALNYLYLFLKPKEKQAQLLKRVHKELRNSLQAGFPPIISVKRFAHRVTGSRRVWREIQGHFVVICQIPKEISADATSFEVKYIDPWGGVIYKGKIKIPERKFHVIDPSMKHPVFKNTPTLVVDFPFSSVGENLLRGNERSETLIYAAILLRSK